jgi:ABC-2 type transport system permease protein
MFSDVLTIIHKELKEMFLRRGSYRSGLFNMVIILGLVGIMLPLQTGVEWLTNPLLIIVWSWLPVFMALSMVTDAFAGERERHTLETLLASRLSDRAILFGKIGASVSYAWGMSITGMLLAVVTINIAHPALGLQFYPLPLFGAAIVVSFLAGLLFSSLGVIVSLRAETARQAYQRMSVVMIVLWLLPTLGLQFLPDSAKSSLNSGLQGINITAILLAGIGVLVVSNIILILIAMARFQRARLILD